MYFSNSKYNYTEVQVVAIFYSYTLWNTFHLKVCNSYNENAKNDTKLPDFVISKLYKIITTGALSRK